MIKYQILSLLFWPDIKIGKIINNGWFLGDIQIDQDRKILLRLRNNKNKKDEIVLQLTKNNSNKSANKISKNFGLFILSNNEKSAREIINKHYDLIKRIAFVIKKNDKTDFLFLESADYYRKNPIGIVFTITHKCTMNCPFCFNSYDYKIGERNKLKDLSTKKIKEAIDCFYAGGIRYIIISGGEPLARLDFFNILDYLCKKKIYVILNTNGVLINEKMAARLCDYPMHIMMSIHQFNNKESNKAANIRNVYSKKTAAVKYLRKYGAMCLEYITILDKKNIKNLEKIYKLNLTDLKPDNWQFFRLFDVNGQPGSTGQDMAAAIDKLDKLNRQYGLNYKIVDSVPFCAHNNPSKAAKVISGELRSDHLVKLVTDPIGNIKMMCSFQRDLGNVFISTAKQCWQKKFAQKMINLEFSPEECRCCPFLKDCCGGSRFLAYVHYGSYSAPDPLANFENIKQFIKA